jgi:alkaline phosphatase D
LRLELRSFEGETLVPDETKVVSRPYSNDVVYKVLFSRDPLKEYNLFVFQNDKIVDQRLVGRGQRDVSKIKLAVASCMDDFYPESFKIWDELARRNPEYLLLIGDNVYADKKDLETARPAIPEIIWQRYVDLRYTLPLYFQQKLIPTHALWDDHDYGINNGDSSFPYKDESKEIFETFWAQDLSQDDWTKTHGVGGLLSLGYFNLYFLDARFFRSQDESGSHLGQDQTAWLISKIREEETPSLLIKGDQFFGGYHPYESFERQHPEDFQSFISELKKVDTPFIFMSGDRHISEIMQFPRGLFSKPSFEITSSPMHGKTYNQEDSNPWRVVSEKGRHNFTIIENIAKDNHWFLDVENIGVEGEVHFRRELAVYIKDLQNNLNEVRKRRFGKRRYRVIKPAKRKRR